MRAPTEAGMTPTMRADVDATMTGVARMSADPVMRGMRVPTTHTPTTMASHYRPSFGWFLIPITFYGDADDGAHEHGRGDP